MNKPSWDRQKQRAVINWRFPREVHPLTGPWYRARFPKAVTLDSADKLSLAIHLPEFFGLIDAARVKLGQPSGRLEIWGEGIRQREAVVAEVESVWQAKVEQVQFYKTARKLGIDIPVAAPAGEVEVEAVISAWVEERTHDRHPPGPKSVANKRSKLAALFAFLGHRNMGAITEAELKRYRLHLLPLGLAHDHLSDIVVMFRVAHRNGFLPLNPAADLVVPRKVRNSRDVFSPTEAATILAAARRGDVPVDVEIGGQALPTLSL